MFRNYCFWLQACVGEDCKLFGAVFKYASGLTGSSIRGIDTCPTDVAFENPSSTLERRVYPNCYEIGNPYTQSRTVRP